MFLLDIIPDVLLDIPDCCSSLFELSRFGVRHGSVNHTTNTVGTDGARHAKENILLNALDPTNTGRNRENISLVEQNSYIECENNFSAYR